MDLHLLDNEPAPPPPEQWKFIDNLTSERHEKVSFQRTEAKPDEIDLSGGVAVCNDFPDPDGLLLTAFDDLKQFFAVRQIPQEGAYVISFAAVSNLDFEQFNISVDDSHCQINASDSEGIRRALYFLEDLIAQSDGPFLRKGDYHRKSHVKTRISRCFFGPLKRPPHFRDELLDDVDYYPDNYLAKLAYEGVNGLWLTGTFKDLAQTSIAPGSKNRKKMLAKLNESIRQCRRYGIKLYLFVIEPISFDPDDPILEEYPELGGNDTGMKKGFCPWSDTARTYLEEAAHSIFSSSPGLGGLLCLSSGEWYTLCCNASTNNCPRCKDKPRWATMAESLAAMRRGISKADPEAKLISWPYTQRSLWGEIETVDGASRLPEGVALQHNFESYGSREQLGKERKITDYWLSYIGPSDFFRSCAEGATANGTEMFAKLQVGCSHEVASVPYVPVPANLYRKYSQMRKLGISGAMQCWYFGCYPSLMTKAAGMLSDWDFALGEDDFLKELAQIYWNNVDARKVVQAWELFSDAYDNYPLSNLFGYYGPVHDAISWPLHLKVVNRVLAPNWENHLPTSGDRFGCFLARSNEEELALDDAIELCRRMSEKWNAGLAIFRSLTVETHEQRLDVAVAEALGIQFASALALLEFYKLRESIAFDRSKNKIADLRTMRKIVENEIGRSERMISLCSIDPRLGFNSEAEGYKYFPEKLRWRIDLLKQTLSGDFAEYEKIIADGGDPYKKYNGTDTGARQLIKPDGKWVECAVHGEYTVSMQGAYFAEKFVTAARQGESFFKVACDGDDLCFDFKGDRLNDNNISVLLFLEPLRMYPPYKFAVYSDSRLVASYPYLQQNKHCRGEFKYANGHWSARITVPLNEFKFSSDAMKNIPVNVVVRHHLNKTGRYFVHTLNELHPVQHRWIIGADNPNDFSWLRLG